MANKGINYYSRNFAQIRTDLINYVKIYYNSIYGDFNDASIGMMLLDLVSSVGDMLSFNIDKNFAETQIDYATESKSVLSMARTMGVRVSGLRASVSIVDFSLVLPVLGSTFDSSYAPIIMAGSQVSGNGKIFELTNDSDFSSPFTTGGIPNRLIIPNFDSNNNLLNYTVVKREMVTNGYTKIFKRVINASDVKPFLEIILPDNNVLSITSMISLPGTNYTTDPTPAQFMNQTNKWFEVQALAQDTIFVPDNSQISDNAGIRPGKWLSVSQKFISEYTDLGFLKLILGGGTTDTSSLAAFDGSTPLSNQIGDFINNLSLGETPTANTTMYVQYRVGGGSDTNLGVNVINSLGIVNMSINGAIPTVNSAVRASLTVNNAFPALGGRDTPSVEEIRNLVRYNFSAQNRAVTINDYQTLISLMPGQYGVPFRCGVSEQQNKIGVYVLGLDANGNLTNTSTTTLATNIATYLADYRMINDYVQVTNGRIINLGFQIDLFVDKSASQTQIIGQVINDVQSFMNINNYQMGDSIYLASLVETINNVPGVINVIDLRVYNKVGQGIYSLNQISQPYVDPVTMEIDVSPTNNYTISGEVDTMFEILNPATDILVRVK